MFYKGKHVAVLGAGESGEAAACLLVTEGARVTVLDSANAEKLQAKKEKFKSLGIDLLTGAEADNDPAVYDLGVISPGIDPAILLVRNFVGKKIEMIGELELSSKLCKCPIIAITGTNGKTTTTQLVERMLNTCGVRTMAAGNISPAFAAAVEKSGDLDVMTLEVSSFQLEEIRTFRPRIAVWLNFTPDHLDRYSSLEEYRKAKLRIFENQTAEDFAIVNSRDELPPLKAKTITFSAYESGADFELRDGAIFYRGERVLQMSDTRLRGLHNAENLMAALGVGFTQGLNFDQMLPPLCAYTALPHRCELVRTINGADYVNDSKATNLDALEKALLSETRPVTLIAGGKDKGFEFDTITDLVAQKCRRVMLIGEMSDRIDAIWRSRIHCEKASSLHDAVLRARAGAGPGEVVLLSPGTSSFDMFKNYADRGNQFREIVNSLP
jgi:UDP-N-acetylmuramoylalanine--D-glutamate ligase